MVNEIYGKIKIEAQAKPYVLGKTRRDGTRGRKTRKRETGKGTRKPIKASKT